MTEVVSKFWRRYLEQQEAERKLLARRIQDQIGQKLLLIHNGILKRKSHLYRVVQGALDNVVQHSRSSTVFLEIKCESDHLDLRIEDDGVGFAQTSSQLQSSGCGIRLMHERMRLLGCSLQITSAPSQGTLVRGRIPT